MLLKEIWETCSTDQRHKTSRLKHTRTGENMITVDEMVCLLNHKNHKQTYRTIRQISKNRSNKVVASYRLFTAFLAGSVFCLLTRLQCLIASFSCIYISQGSVATEYKCGGIFNKYFIIANCPQNVPVKEFFKSVNI